MKPIITSMMVIIGILMVGCGEKAQIDKRYNQQNKAYDKAMNELEGK